MFNPAEAKQLFDDKDLAELGVGTQLISLSVKDDRKLSKPIITPIYHTTMYCIESCEGYAAQGLGGFTYNRIRNPNTEELEMTIAQIEHGKGALLFPSGMAVISNTLLCFLKPGDHVVAQSPLYGCTAYILKNICSKFQIEVTYVDSDKDVDEYRKEVKENTTMLYGETLCNPMMHFLDVKKLGELGKEMKILTVVDASFTPPTNHTPLDYEIDIVLHSASKYMSGHSDMLAGCATFNDLDNYVKLRTWRRFTGISQSAFDSVLLMRSLRTLHIRTERHNENGMVIAKFLEALPQVTKVHYIGLASHPQHLIALTMLKGFGGMMAFEMGSRAKAVKVAESTKVFKLALSLGGAESLIEHPGTMTHNKAVISKEGVRGIPDTLLRLSVGLEDSKDQIADLQQAIDKAELEC